MPYSRIHKHKSFCRGPSTRSSLGLPAQFSPEQDAWVRPDAYFDYNGRRDHGNHDDRDKEDDDNHEEEKDVLSAGAFVG